MDFEFEIYKGKKFSSLLKDIVVNSEDRNDTIQKLIDDIFTISVRRQCSNKNKWVVCFNSECNNW